ncbi:MAG: 3-alpha domain-containing protein, partial [Streptosporangiaceae bacterium]
GPERLAVTEADALLYLPGHDRSRLAAALRIPALSPGWQTSFRDLLRQPHDGGWTGNAGLALDIGPAPAWPGFRPMRVAAVSPETRSVFSLELEPADGGPAAPATAGQFLTLRLPAQASRPPLLRAYSLSGPPGSPRYRISVKQEPHGAAGRYLRGHIRAGDTIEVAAPRGAFILRPGSRPVVLLSAGIGVTPVLAILHTLAGQGPARPVWWIYGTRNSAEHPFAAETSRLLGDLRDSRRYIAYSRPLAGDRPGVDFDLEGHLGARALRRLGVLRDSDFYLCGPDGFMRDLRAGLAAWGVPAGQIRAETFGPGQAITPGVIGQQVRPPHPPAGPAGSGPAVSFARSGLIVNWTDAYPSLLDLAEACDVVVRWACRTGVCHTCESGLLGGAVGYQPEPLDPPAAGNVLICCAQPETDIAVDI